MTTATETQPTNFFNASPERRRLYTQAYNELQREFPNVPIPYERVKQSYLFNVLENAAEAN